MPDNFVWLHHIENIRGICNTFMSACRNTATITILVEWSVALRSESLHDFMNILLHHFLISWQFSFVVDVVVFPAIFVLFLSNIFCCRPVSLSLVGCVRWHWSAIKCMSSFTTNTQEYTRRIHSVRNAHNNYSRRNTAEDNKRECNQ